MDNETIAGYDGLVQGGAAPSPELDRLVEQITPENIPPRTYLDELDADDTITPEYIESDIQQVVPKPNAEIRLERLEKAFADLLTRIERYNGKASHRI